MVYWQHWSPGGCVTVLPKNLQRWRADDIRPYMAYPLTFHFYRNVVRLFTDNGSVSLKRIYEGFRDLLYQGLSWGAVLQDRKETLWI